MGITIKQIDNLRHQGIIEHIARTKKYNLAKCVQEYISYKIKPQNGTVIDKEREQAEHERLKKELTQLTLRKRRGELLEKDDVENFLSEMLFDFREKLSNILGKITPELLMVLVTNFRNRLLLIFEQ